MKKTAKTLILSIVFALAIAAPASAHHVDAAASSADCTKVIAKYIGFTDSDKPVNEKITIDGTTVYTKSGYTWSGSDNSHSINYPNALTSGDHTIVFTATWSTQGSNNGTFSKQVSCGSPPPPPSTGKVNASMSSADCTKVTAKYESFDDDDKPVNEKITVDGTTVYTKNGYTWSGTSNAHVVSYSSALKPGNHTVVFTATWSTQGSNNGAFTVKVYCQAPPPPPVNYGCDGKMVDSGHPAAVCPGPTVTVPGPATATTVVAPQGIICRSEGRLVLYTKHSKILAQRLYVNGKLVASNHPNANSHVTRFDVPDVGDSYSLRIVARLRSQRNGRKFRWTKTVKVQRCGVAPARTLHIDP
jgi:hypothetical protein